MRNALLVSLRRKGTNQCKRRKEMYQKKQDSEQLRNYSFLSISGTLGIAPCTSVNMYLPLFKTVWRAVQGRDPPLLLCTFCIYLTQLPDREGATEKDKCQGHWWEGEEAVLSSSDSPEGNVKSAAR